MVTAIKEVLLCAGSVGTTQILQLSGIGNSNDLNSFGIKTIVNNPSVGDNLSDHTLLPNIFSVKDGQSFDDFLRNSTQVNEAIQQWVANKTGIFANNVVNNFGFARLPSNATIFSTTPDPAAGPGSPHWEIILSVRPITHSRVNVLKHSQNFWFNPGIPQPSTGNFMTVVAVLISPTSRASFLLILGADKGLIITMPSQVDRSKLRPRIHLTNRSLILIISQPISTFLPWSKQ